MKIGETLTPQRRDALADGGPHVVMLVRNPYSHDTRVEKEAATLRDAGYRVTVVADSAPGLPEGEDREGAAVLRVGRRGLRVPGLSFAIEQWHLSRVLSAQGPAVLHAHDSNALLPVLIASRMRKVPFVYDAHDLWLHRPRRQRSRLYHAVQNAYYRLIERIAIPRARATLTVSPPMLRHLERRYRLSRVELVPNYPDHTPPDRRLELRALPELAAAPSRAPLVLYLGGLMGGRGLEQLVRAMASVPDAHLVLLGGGHLTEPLLREAERSGVRARVHLVPPVPSESVVAYASSADVGVSPIVPSCLNYRYSLPNKLFQYMAAGIPVVASDFEQVREVVVGSGAGRVVDTREPEAIARAINEILADPEAARAMGARGRAAVEERYNWSVSAAALVDVYRGIVSVPLAGPSSPMVDGDD